MITYDVLVITGATVLLCVAHWRAGVIATLILGLALDPMRKLVVGEPLYLSGLVFVLVGATLIGLRLRGVSLSPRPIFAWSSAFRVPLILFLLLVLFQSVAAITRSGSWVIGLIGLVAYLAPIPGVLIGFAYARSTTEVRKLVRWYIGAVIVMAVGIYLSRAGYDWRLLDAVGVGLVAYTPTGDQLALASGFFRTPEIAAWHVAMATCFTIMLFLSRRRIAVQLWPTVVVVLYLALALMFTGRRKGIIEVAIFVLVFLLMIAYFRRQAMKTALILALVCFFTVALFALTELGELLGISGYYARGTNIGMEEAGRYQRLSTGALKFVIQRNGWLGSGAGTASQGAQYFGGGSSLVGRASEGGIGKIVAELGVPGLVMLVVLGVAVTFYLWKIARAASRGDVRRAYYALGMIALLVANAVIFAVAHQVFGDPLVLYVIGLVLGMTFAIPHMRPAPVRPQGQRPSGEPTVPAGSVH
ncbi:MAG TPA: hypothetical protein VIE68_09820 [Gemmatimonadota bacterium]|jgi:hypothetical protein